MKYSQGPAPKVVEFPALVATDDQDAADLALANISAAIRRALANLPADRHSELFARAHACLDDLQKPGDLTKDELTKEPPSDLTKPRPGKS